MKDFRRTPRNMTSTVGQPCSKPKKESDHSKLPVDEEVSLKRHINLTQEKEAEHSDNSGLSYRIMMK